MIEIIIKDYLKNSGIKVYLEEPEKQPEEYVIIEKQGSSDVNYITTAMIAIQSYAGSLYKAALLNDKVKKLMKNIVSLDTVSACDCNSDYNYTDPETKRYRYQAVFDVVYYDKEE